MRRTPAFAAALATLTALVSLTACGTVEDAAKSAASDAACSVAGQAADETGRQAGKVVDDIGANPKSAESQLRGIRDTLAAAEKGADGDLKDKIGDARSAVEKLLGQAQGAAEGAEVDTTAVTDARDDLDTAVEDVKNLC